MKRRAEPGGADRSPWWLCQSPTHPGPVDLDGMHAALVGQRFLGDADALAVGTDVLTDLDLCLHADDRPLTSQ